MPTRLTIATADDMRALGRRIGAVLRAGDLVLLRGELGAGKTTLAQGIGEALGVRGPITSPTFVLSRVHPPLRPGGVPMLHVDAYRLGSAAELDDLDLDWDAAAAVVEWGDGLLDGVAESWLHVAIDRAPGGGEGERQDLEADDPRVATIEAHGERWAGVDW